MSVPRIKKRRRFFLGCEGKSEKGYGQFVQEIALEKSLNITFEIFQCSGGDPSVVVNNAISGCAEEDSADYPFKGRFLFVDSDRLEDIPDEDVTRLMNLLSQNNFVAIWQNPDHEGFLLRHFSGHENDCPPRGHSLKALQSVWPDYRKGMTRRDYIKNIKIDDVKRAAGKNSDLESFLRAIGLM